MNAGAVLGLVIGAAALLLTGVIAALSAVSAYGRNVQALSTLTAEARAVEATLQRFGERMGSHDVRINTLETRAAAERDERNFTGQVRG